MERTVKELADELGVSKSGIRKYLNASFREKYTFQNANRILIKEAGAKEIRRKVKNRTTHKTHTGNAFKSAFKDGESVRTESVLIKQLQEKDEQIARLQKLLDQSQQLQLMAENKIKQLESKTVDEQVKNDASERTTQSGNVDVPTNRSDRGFWARLFNK